MNALYYTRLLVLLTSIIIVIGSIGLHNINSGPLNIPELKEQVAISDNWIIQTIADRRLISTLVAAQASIFCPLFVLAANITIEITDSIVEMACQFLMPMGLAVCWIFSILFDLKSTDILVNGNVCLINDNCFAFMLLHGLKYVNVCSFTLEPILVGAFYYRSRRIQLKDDEKF